MSVFLEFISWYTVFKSKIQNIKCIAHVSEHMKDCLTLERSNEKHFVFPVILVWLSKCENSIMTLTEREIGVRADVCACNILT